MKDKKLLNETQVKRFMKLAGNHALSETFVGNLSEEGLYKDDELAPEPSLDELPGEELGGDEEAPLEEPLEGGEEVADAGPMSKVRDIVADAVMDALSGAVETGELDISEEEPAEGLPGEEAEGLPGEEAEGLPGEEVEEPMGAALEEADIDYLDEEEVVNETLKRIAARLVKESKKEKLIDQLTARISKRLK